MERNVSNAKRVASKKAINFKNGKVLFSWISFSATDEVESQVGPRVYCRERIPKWSRLRLLFSCSGCQERQIKTKKVGDDLTVSFTSKPAKCFFFLCLLFEWISRCLFLLSANNETIFSSWTTEKNWCKRKQKELTHPQKKEQQAST